MEPERLKAALEAVFANYALFSTVLSHDEAGVPVFRYVPGMIVHPEIREVEEHTKDTLAALIRPYRLDGELLYRCAIYATKEYVYLDWDTSHIISDGCSRPTGASRCGRITITGILSTSTGGGWRWSTMLTPGC